MKGIVHVRIVDEPLPAHRGSGFFKIHPHDQHQRIADLICQSLEADRIVHGGADIVDGTGPHHYKQTGVLPVDNALQNAALAENKALQLPVQGILGLDLGGVGKIVRATTLTL